MPAMARSPASPRPLRRSERALAYGLAGWAAEVVFTGAMGVLDRRTRDVRAEGHSYLWMGPIYALCACLYEPLRDSQRSQPWWRRAAAYAAGLTAGEYLAGMALKRLTGTIPWDYTGHTPLSVQGATRLDYIPVWAVFGLLLEHVDDVLRGAEIHTEAA